MPPKRIGTNRKARTADEGVPRLFQPDSGNCSSPSCRSLRSNVTEFEEIIKGSGILPASNDLACNSNYISNVDIHQNFYIFTKSVYSVINLFFVLKIVKANGENPTKVIYNLHQENIFD
jgi:hypothetical protein